ncbi:MAG: leucine-rich repeat domain-containing protein [Lachnospiraceae bacterium]|nr:leucine-rich repeat domain-containing protein [Lachnospiraceae bacterium]
MKRLKEYCMVWVLVFVVLLGGKVKAEELTQIKDSKAQEILIKMQEEMKQIKVLQTELLIDGETMMVLTVDSNTGVSYVNLYGSEIWVDQKAKIAYMKENGKYYFMPSESSASSAEDTADELMDVDSLVDMTYEGIVTYKNQECYKLRNVQSVEGEEISVDYYIDMQYRLVARVIQSEASSLEVVWNYPESYSVPEEVKKNAQLIAGYRTKKSKITYVSKFVKGETVFYADSAKSAKGSVKIPDSIKVCGKSYKVYGISNGAFKGNKKINSVTIGKNVVKIGKQAFYKCSKLKNVRINSKSLNSVGSKAFYGNAKKLKVKVPKAKLSKYKKMIRKSKTSSNITVTKF